MSILLAKDGNEFGLEPDTWRAYIRFADGRRIAKNGFKERSKAYLWIEETMKGDNDGK